MSGPKKAKAHNPGWFKKGSDPRRHPLSRLDGRKGYQEALRARMPSRVRCWLRRKIGRHYQAQRGRARQRPAG
jgi:hypothetical protein